MPDSNPRDRFFYLPLTHMIDSYINLYKRDKNREFSRVWYALVEMDATYVIVKVYVTERNDAIKHHSNVITIWRTSAIEVTTLLKNLRSEMKGGQGKESIMGVSGR